MKTFKFTTHNKLSGKKTTQLIRAKTLAAAKKKAWATIGDKSGFRVVEVQDA